MKPLHAWHHTPFGRIARFLGSIQLAVPVMAMVAVALAWGTYLESTHNATVSKASVYGAWWFVGLMGLICISLVFAVITRFPWKKRHVGFITVHAGLVMLIAGGFWSLFGRVEGHVSLEEGTASNILEMDREVLELAELNAGKPTVLATSPAPKGPANLEMGGVSIKVIGRWENIREEQYVANENKSPLRAVEISLDSAFKGQWVGEEAKAGGASTVGSLLVRVLADGSEWAPPSITALNTPGFFFVVGGVRYPLSDTGEVFPGWTIVSVQRFQKATVSAGTLSEGSGGDNPAVEAVISDGKGTTERHTAFQNFPEMTMARTIAGDAKSGAKLTTSQPTSVTETLVIFGPVSAPRVGYIGTDGAGTELPAPASLPAVIDAGSRKVTLLRQFSHAMQAARFVEAPPGPGQRSALVLEQSNSIEPVVLPWNSYESVSSNGRNLAIRYGAGLLELPFSIKLNDFRKLDYPGTEMAMAYESEVIIASPGRSDTPFLIHMNSPYGQGPWKVYQSGFLSETHSVFSVMRDPGLPLTYLGSTVLCVGIFVTFFSRSFSWGHPGIPAAFTHKEAASAPVDPAPAPRAAARDPEPVGARV